MAVKRRYTVQIVIMTTPGQGEWIKERAQRYGVSEAQIARDTIALGQDKLAAHYAKVGIRPDGLPEKAGSARGKVPTKRNGSRSRVPAATFVAPAGEVLQGAVS